ncbi:MAG: LPS assembly lipoprotein LptE [Arenimonas sp.]|jgi:LPS-assembly lipoprotein
MRRVLILLSAALLAACGFHPRAQLNLPAALGPISVQTAEPYSSLGLELARALERAGATPPTAGKPSSVLKVTGEAWNTAPLSVDQFARVREYITRYKVDFVLVGADGALLIEPQSIELAREYTYDINASAGSPAEQELIQRELRRDMEAAILRRLDVVLRPKP